MSHKKKRKIMWRETDLDGFYNALAEGRRRTTYDDVTGTPRYLVEVLHRPRRTAGRGKA